MANTNVQILKLSTCTNLDVIDKINELIDNLNIPESINIDASEGKKCLISSISEFQCKLTIITENKSILVFSITNNGNKEIRPLFVETTTDEFSNYETDKKFLYISENNNIILNYENACTVLIDGISGEYDKLYPETSEISDTSNVSVGTAPSDWGLYVPFSIVRDREDSWLTLTNGYSNNGKTYQFTIGFDETVVRGLITELDERLSALIQGILDVIGNRDDVWSDGTTEISIEKVGEFSAMQALRLTFGEDTYVFGTDGPIFYYDGYVYFGDTYNSTISNAGFEYLKEFPDYINIENENVDDKRKVCKVGFDRIEFEELIQDLSGIYLYDASSEDDIIQSLITNPEVVEVTIPSSEPCDTIWANINKLDGRIDSTEINITNLSNSLDSLEQRVAQNENNISELQTTVSEHTQNITDLTNRLDEIYREDEESQSGHAGILQDEIDRNDEQDSRLDELLKKTIDPDTQEVMSETGRVKDLEDAVEGINSDLDNLKKLSPYNVEMDLDKEYTCIASIQRHLDEHDVAQPFNAEYDVITENNDEIQFIVSNNKIQLLNLTNNSYTFLNSNGPSLVQVDSFSAVKVIRATIGNKSYVFGTESDIFYYNGYVYFGDKYPFGYLPSLWETLKEDYPDYVNKNITSNDDQRTFYKLQIDQNLVNQLATDASLQVIELSNESELSDYFSSNPPAIVNDGTPDIINKELVIVEFISEGANIYLKKFDSSKSNVSVTIVNYIDCDLVSTYDDSLDYSEFSNQAIKLTYDTNFLRNIDPLITTSNDSGLIITDKMEPLNPSNPAGINNPQTRKTELALDAAEVEFNDQQFDITQDTQLNKTTISIKSEIISNDYRLSGSTTTSTDTDFYLTVTKDGNPVNVHDLYVMATEGTNMSMEVTSSISDIDHAIFELSRQYVRNVPYNSFEYIEFSYIGYDNTSYKIIGEFHVIEGGGTSQSWHGRIYDSSTILDIGVYYTDYVQNPEYDPSDPSGRFPYIVDTYWIYPNCSKNSTTAQKIASVSKIYNSIAKILSTGRMPSIRFSTIGRSYTYYPPSGDPEKYGNDYNCVHYGRLMSTCCGQCYSFLVPASTDGSSGTKSIILGSELDNGQRYWYCGYYWENATPIGPEE